MSFDQTPSKASPSAPKEGQDMKLKPAPPEHHVKCPRCDSPNTKFCYYNNYNLSQPRHFCKTCRRYWTKGGALRNVPIGGGCRKNKKMKQRLAGISNSRDSTSCEIMGSTSGGHNFFQGFLTPAMEFQLGSINPPQPLTASMFPLSGTDANFTMYQNHHDKAQHNSSHHPLSGAIGFDNYLRPSVEEHVLDGSTLQMGSSSNNSMIVHSNLASSIESLSSINQELHWKLQQQRLAVLFSSDPSEKLSTQSNMAHMGQDQFDHQTHEFQLQPILFQNLETGIVAAPFSTGDSRMEDHEASGKSRLGENNVGSATEWFFDVNPYTNGRSNINESLNNNEDNNMDNLDEGGDNQNHNWSAGIQAWSNMQQYNGASP